jgi:hypothetical protein
LHGPTVSPNGARRRIVPRGADLVPAQFAGARSAWRGIGPGAVGTIWKRAAEGI